MASKSMLTRPSVIVALLLSSPAIAAAEVLLYEDFQDGTSDGWRAFGSGTLSITEYQGNASLKMTKDAMAARAVPTKHASHIRVGASFAATGLSDDEACIAEATIDSGVSWVQVLQVGPDDADGVTLYSGAVSIDLDDEIRVVWIRARVAGSRSTDVCWLDNVFVAGGGIPASAPTARKLTAEFLTGAGSLPSAVAMSEFEPGASNPATGFVFSGRLTLAETPSFQQFEIINDDAGRLASHGDDIRRLPEFDFRLVQRGNDLVPLKQGVQRRAHSYWEIALQPGRAWHEDADGDWHRAALPFALRERSANCTHNGIMTWLFRSDGAVSRVFYQVSSETCGYFKFDMWGAVDADYTPEDLTEIAIPAIDRLDAHRLRRVPVRPIDSLVERFPHVEQLSLGLDDGIHPRDMSVFGLIVDGIHYRSDCFTRHGPFPFCDSLPLPSYSTAKSIMAGIAVMRLEQLFPGVSQTEIRSLIEACSDRRWHGVTVEHALDMATGNYRSTVHSNDESDDDHIAFVFADTHADKIDAACSLFRRKADPGSQFVYHTSDTYLVGTALQAWLDRHDGPMRDLYRDVLAEPVWKPLGLSPLLDDSLRTYDDVAQPFAGYGLTLESDDIVRIGLWLQDGARLDGIDMLSNDMLRGALQRDEEDIGLDTGIPDVRYNNGFWAYDAGPLLNCGDSAWIPFMSGVSGTTVALFPNRVIYYYFSDGYTYRWRSGIRAAHAIRPLCH